MGGFGCPEIVAARFLKKKGRLCFFFFSYIIGEKKPPKPPVVFTASFSNKELGELS